MRPYIRYPDMPKPKSWAHWFWKDVQREHTWRLNANQFDEFIRLEKGIRDHRRALDIDRAHMVGDV